MTPELDARACAEKRSREEGLPWLVYTLDNERWHAAPAEDAPAEGIQQWSRFENGIEVQWGARKTREVFEENVRATGRIIRKFLEKHGEK